MTSTESWNKIVSLYNKNKTAKEAVIQNAWENIFSELLGYSRLDGDIDSHRSVKMGVNTKYPDIILRSDDSDLFVVELKRHILHEGREQLFSYLKQLKLDVGVLVCNKLYVFDYDYFKQDSEQEFVEIEFMPDNSLGASFVELFSKQNFDKAFIKDFISEQAKEVSSVSKIQSQLNDALLVDLVKAHFEKDYDSRTVEAALSEYSFSCIKKTSYSAQAAPISASPSAMPSTQNGNAPEVVLMIGNRVVSSQEFKKLLLITRMAKRIWHYKDRTEEDVWDASKFTPESNLMGNIHPTKYRHWKTSGLTKVVCIIEE